jgi:hypothetical protein
MSKNDTSGTVTGVPTTTVFAATGLGTVNHYLGRTVRFTSGVNVGLERYVTGYDPALSQFTVAALPSAPTAGDTFLILANIPASASIIIFTGMSESAAANAIPIAVAVAITSANDKTVFKMPGAISQAVGYLSLHPGIVHRADDGDVTVLFDSTTSWTNVTELCLYYMTDVPDLRDA